MCYFDHIFYKRTKKIAFILKIIVPITAVGYLLLFTFTSRSYIHKKPELITIKQGDSLRETTYGLYRKKLITNPYLFYFIGFISGYSEYIEAGTYYVSANQSPASIYHEFVNGRVASVKVTVPPGLNIFQIAKILAKNKITGKKSFLKECFDRKLLLSIGIDKKNVEGFLYPNTYIFKINSNPVKIIREMVTEFDIKTKNLKLGYKNLIIASIITKEANEDSRRNMRLVSSVIHNRLKINMPLDIDSTSIYARNLLEYKKYLKTKRNGSFNPALNMNSAYLKIKSPYNTYSNYGLPPTPIANPNISAIRAAANPAKTRYLYYISTKHGKTIFANDLAGQVKNINEYLK